MRQPGAHQEHVHLFMRRYHDTENKRQPIGRHCSACMLLGLAFALSAPAALAQLSGSLAVLSDYRFRGRSLSDDHATAQLTLNYDSDNLWYAGAMAAHAKVEDTGTAHVVAYGGYAQRLSSGIGWEAGASQTLFTRFAGYNYLEAYLGVSGEHASARLYYSPRYFGRSARTMYAELNGFLPLGETLRMVGHLGWLRALNDEDSIGMVSGHRYDYRLGVAAHLGDVDLQLARVTRAARRYPGYSGYPANTGSQPHAFVLSASYSF